MRDTIKTLLSSIVDYAGLFPPAQLGLQTAMETYVRHQTESNCWMLGRFVLPVAHLNSFADLVSNFALQQWSLSLILSQDIASDIQAIDAFRHDSIAIESLEFPFVLLKDIDRIDSSLPDGIELFFEVPLNQELLPYLAALKGMNSNINRFAKIRTGGVTLDAFPGVDRLSQFMIACHELNLPFKATAGLHHPLRSRHPVTYEPESDTAIMHGFLNVAIGSAFLHQRKITPEQLSLLLQENSLQSLQFNDDQMVWQIEDHSYELSLAEIESARQQFFRSFGSCSFAEPVQDLKVLNLL